MTPGGIDVDFTRFMSQPKAPRADQVNAGDDQALRQVTREFESLFVKQMLDAMRDTLNPEEGLFYGGEAEKMFQDMLNMEHAREMSHAGSFGLADAMYDQMTRSSGVQAYEKMGNSLP